MLAADEDALICDLAETYGIYDFRALPVRLLATLCVGLRDNSRIKMRLTGSTVPTDTILLAAAVDRLSFLSWAKTEDAESGRNRPEPILALLLGQEHPGDGDTVLFDSGEEFERVRARILSGGGNGGD